MPEAPDRLTIATCIGCGAMNVWGTCETGCSEHRLDLVPAEDYDQLVATTAASAARVEAFAVLARRLAALGDDDEDAYRAARDEARAALREHGVSPPADDEVRRVTSWWCPECGGLEAPAPCIGVCIRRPAEWVNAELHEAERARAADVRGREAQLVTLLRQVAFVTPRAGRWAENLAVIRERARRAGSAASRSR